MAFQETWRVVSVGLTAPNLFAPLGSPNRTEHNVFTNCLTEFHYKSIFFTMMIYLLTFKDSLSDQWKNMTS